MTAELMGIVFSINNMSAMVDFYRHVFGANWQAGMQVGEHQFYQGNWLGLDWVLCPNVIAGVVAEQNRHQLRLKVPDLRATLQLAVQYSGRISSEPIETNHILSASVTDPDGNTLELFQNL